MNLVKYINEYKEFFIWKEIMDYLDNHHIIYEVGTSQIISVPRSKDIIYVKISRKNASRIKITCSKATEGGREGFFTYKIGYQEPLGFLDSKQVIEILERCYNDLKKRF